MFYEDLVESEHYVNDIMKSVTSNSKLLTRLSGENNKAWEWKRYFERKHSDPT